MVLSSILGRFVTRAEAKGGAHGFWRFPISGRRRPRVSEASVRPERLERAIVTPKTRGARAARNRRTLRPCKKKHSEWSGTAMVGGGTERGRADAMHLGVGLGHGDHKVTTVQIFAQLV